MKLLHRLKRAFHLGAYRRDVRSAVEDELRFYLEMRAREFQEREGMGPEEARRAALEVFGDLERIEDETVRVAERRARRMGRWTMMGELKQDLAWAVRSWSRSPGVALVAVVTVALGIGANTAIFSLADRVFFRSPPVEAPEELVRVHTTCRDGDPRCASSWPDYLDYREGTDALSGLAAYSWVPVNAATGESAWLADAMVVSGDYFPVLGLEPAAGRLLQPADNTPGGANDVVVLSWSVWQTRYGADPGVVGRTLHLNGTAFQVVGVAPEGFSGVDLGDESGLFVPIHAGRLLGPVGSAGDPEAVASRTNRWIFGLVGRLAEGATVERARAELLAVSEELRREDPDARGTRSVTVEAAPGYTLAFAREDTSRLVWLLLGVVGITLLLACANLANLLLARAEERRQELGVRVALGAGGGRLVRQLLVEALVLAVAGGAAGLVVARVGVSALAAYQLPGGIPLSALGLELDGRVFAFAAAASVATGFLFGLLPALRARRTDVVASLKGSPRGASAGGGRTRGALVALQVGLCAVLLVGSGLFLRTLQQGLDRDLGFEKDGVAAARFNLGLLDYEGAEADRLVAELTERVGALPGVRSASAGTLVPLQQGGHRGAGVAVEGYEPAPDEEIRAEYAFVLPGYFESLGMELVAGRPLGLEDRPGGALSGVISRAMARRYWPEGQAVGGLVELGGNPVRVVGVVEDATWRSLDDAPENFLFLSMNQIPGRATGFVTLVARTDGEAEALLPLIRREVRALEPDLSLTFLRTMEQMVGEVLMPQRLGALLLTSLGALALVLAAVGIWGVVGYAVRRRTREMGIRMALGSSRSGVMALVARGMAGPVLLGLIGGLGAAWFLGRTARAFLFEVSPTDALTFVVTALGLTLVAGAATLLPARRATRVDPREALGTE